MRIDVGDGRAAWRAGSVGETGTDAHMGMQHDSCATPRAAQHAVGLHAAALAALWQQARRQLAAARACRPATYVRAPACDMQPATLALLWPMPVAGVSMPRVRSAGLRLLRLLLWCRANGPTGQAVCLRHATPESMLRHVVCASCATGGAFCGASDHRARRGLLDPDRPHRADRCARRLFALFANAMEKCPLGQQSIL